MNLNMVSSLVSDTTVQFSTVQGCLHLQQHFSIEHVSIRHIWKDKLLLMSNLL